MNQPMPATQPRKSGGALKWILLGCGGLVFLAVAFFAVTGYLIARNFTTDPAKAEAGTIRKQFAESIERNSVHGSDSPDNARIEIGLNFKPEEIVG